MQLRQRPIGINAVAVDHRARPRAVVISVTVAEVGWIFKLPIQLARRGVEALDALRVPDSMQEDEIVTLNRGRRIRGALI